MLVWHPHLLIPSMMMDGIFVASLVFPYQPLRWALERIFLLMMMMPFSCHSSTPLHGVVGGCLLLLLLKFDNDDDVDDQDGE